MEKIIRSIRDKDDIMSSFKYHKNKGIIMSEYKQIRLNPDVRELLDEYKMNGESYSIAIGRLFKENNALKEDKDKLMKMAMKTPDSIALPNINHSVIFAITQVLKMDYDSEEDKLKSLKIYLRPSLAENYSQVYSIIDGFKEEYPEYSPILDKLLLWIKDNDVLFGINQIGYDNALTYSEKLDKLKEFLRPYLEDDIEKVKSIINSIDRDNGIQFIFFNTLLLDDLNDWIDEDYSDK